ncbi:extended synaptotagmin-1, partial [Plakobranchus ocellatus]
WVFSSTNIEELVKKRLDERLWDIRPSFVDSLELSAFNVGDQTPHIKNVRTFECSESTPGSLQPISWFNVHRPPAGLDKASSYQVVVEADISMMSEDFKMIFRGRVGSAKVNVGFDLVVEDLTLAGTLQAIVCLSMDNPFPHINKATICFKEKPDVTFNIRMLRALSLMEIPLLKSWIHNNVMEGLTKAMVDPASVDINVSKVGPTLMGQNITKRKKAQGVLTIHIKGYPPKEAAAEDIRYTVLNIGDRKRQTHEVPATEEWEDVCSFFIYSLAQERIKVKSKCMRLLTSTTLEQNEINLSSFPFQVQPTCETTVKNKDESIVTLSMQYTTLPAINLSDIEDAAKPKSSSVAGVLYVCIHGASNVLAADKTGASDPYCVLFCDRRRVLTTPFIPRTRNPHWESWTEFFVADYTRMQLSFFVYDWDGHNNINDDFLGSVHLNLSDSTPEIIKKSMTLGYNRPDEGFTVDKACGQITISVVFRPVPSVAKSEKFREVMKSYKPNDYLYREDLMSPSSVAGVPGRRSTAAAYMDELLSDKVIIELTILQGKDLVAMDRNGYSDPFCVVSVKGKKVLTTAVKKKTLFPKWNETVTTEMSLADAPDVKIDVFDKDMISNDFMGTVKLSLDQLKELSLKASSDWYSLEKTKSGKLQLKCHVISKDTLTKLKEDSVSSDNVFEFPSPAKMGDITNSSFGSASPERNTVPTIALHPPPKEARSSVDTQNAYSPPDGPAGHVTNGYQSPTANGAPNSGTLPRKRGPKLARTDSTNSVNIMQRSADRVSLRSESSAGDKMYGVSGKVTRARGEFPPTANEIYCKVRLEVPGNRLSLLHHSRIIGKSPVVSLMNNGAELNVNFEVDRGQGIAHDALLIFDLKHSSKEHLATRSYAIRSLLAEATAESKWIPLGNGIELEILMKQGEASPDALNRKGSGIFKSLSFRKDK